jgi:5-methylcytosine-specific restriction endonuclease McrA
MFYKGHKHSQATKDKIGKANSVALKGHKAPKTAFKKGETFGEKNKNWKGGKPKCIECGKELGSYYAKRCVLHSNRLNLSNPITRKKLGDACRGEKAYQWKGGISPKSYPAEFNPTLKLKIRQRDNFTCCLCGRTEREELEELDYVLCVNHIDFDKNNCSEENLNTLCRRCNVKINRERDYWTNYFQNARIYSDELRGN